MSCHRGKGDCGSRIGTVELGFAGGEVPQAFVVCHCECGLELAECAVGGSKGKPVVTCMGEHTSGFKEEMCEVNSSGIRYGVIAGHSNAVNFTEAFPQQVDWLIWGAQG